MNRFRVLDRNLAAGIQAALDEGDRSGPVPVAEVQAVLSALEAEWEAESQVDARISRFDQLNRRASGNGRTRRWFATKPAATGIA